MEGCCHIVKPGGGGLIQLRDAQRAALESVESNRYVIVLKARQIGYSTLFALHALWYAIFHPEVHVVFLSIGEREAIALLKKTKHALKKMPPWVTARMPQLVKDTQEELEFDNGSRIRSLPSKKDPARGETVDLVYVDEWAFFENPEDAWQSIEPITDVGGRIVGLSTANGWGNFFHTQWVRAKTGTSNFKPLFFPWSANTDRDDNWYSEKARNNPEWHMAQEYPRNEDEAFLKSGRPVFDLEMLHQIPTFVGIHGAILTHKFEEKLHGEIELWDYPDEYDFYVVGADVAEGLEHGDYSSAHVVSCRTGLVVAHYHAHVEADVFGEDLRRLGLYYHGALMGVEVNNHGLSTLHALRRLDYPRIYFRTTLNLRTNRQTNEMGWRTTLATKGLMVDELGMALREGDLVLRDEETIAELKTFVRDEKGKMGGSPFDDRVISLAIANQMRRYAHARDLVQQKEVYMTGAWWGDQLDQAKQQGQNLQGHIGQHSVRAGQRGH